MEMDSPDTISINSFDPAAADSSNADLHANSSSPDPARLGSHDAMPINSSDPPATDSFNGDLQQIVPSDSSNDDLHQNFPSDSSYVDLHQHLLSDGDVHQNLPSDSSSHHTLRSLHPNESSNSNLAGQFEESRSANQDFLEKASALRDANLLDELEETRSANQDLVEEASSLRDALSEKEQTAELLQKQLQEKRGRVLELSAEILSLEVENRKLAEIAAFLAQEVQTLHAEKDDLQDENAKITLETGCLDVTFREAVEKLAYLISHLDERKAALAGAEAQVLLFYFEVEKLRLEKGEYSKEISMLDAMNAHIVNLQEAERDLLSETNDILTAKTWAEQQLSYSQDAVCMKSSLGELDEVNARLRYLQAQDNAMALQEAGIVARIKDLERQLHTLKVNFDTTRKALGQEETNVNSSRTLEMACMKVKASDGDLQAARSAPEMQVEEADGQQHVEELESQVAALREETRGLVQLNEELKAILMQQQNEMVVSTQLSEDVKKLEGNLNEAEEKAQALKEREEELKFKMQELTISISKKPKLGGLTTPLVISGGTIVVVGLLIYLWHAKAKSK